MTEAMKLCGSQIAYGACRFGGRIDWSAPKPMAKCHASDSMYNRCPYRDWLELEHKKFWLARGARE